MAAAAAATVTVAPVPVPAPAPAPATQPPASKDVASARKRRRRAPAGGAADDCFTCAKRNVKCDRRRPYCAQCLEIGNDCSGYKTQLTWGVGVASRGKLRGLSLPIAKAPPVNAAKAAAASLKSPSKSSAGSIVVASPTWTAASPAHHTPPSPLEEDARRAREDGDVMAAQRSPASVLPLPAPLPPPPLLHFSKPVYDRRLSLAENPAPTLSRPSGWTPISMPSTYPPAEVTRFQGRSLQLQLPGTGEMLGSSLDSMPDVEYLSPISHSFSREDMAFIHSPTVLDDGFPNFASHMPQSPASAIMMQPSRVPSLIYAPSESESSLHSHSHVDMYETQLNHKMVPDCESPGRPGLARTADRVWMSASLIWPYSIRSHGHGFVQHQRPVSRALLGAVVHG